jgi:hypothetical protein
MSGVALTKFEKTAVPKLRLHNSSNVLNSFVIANHKLEKKQEVKEKNNQLLNGLGIKTKVVKINKIVKSRNHADTELLNNIIKMIPIKPIHTKAFSKILRTSDRITQDGCKFLYENKLIHCSGVNRYKRCQTK